MRAQPPGTLAGWFLYQARQRLMQGPPSSSSQLLQTDRIGQEWEQLVASVHDAPGSRGRAWYENMVRECGAEPRGEDL